MYCMRGGRPREAAAPGRRDRLRSPRAASGATHEDGDEAEQDERDRRLTRQAALRTPPTARSRDDVRREPRPLRGRRGSAGRSQAAGSSPMSAQIGGQRAPWARASCAAARGRAPRGRCERGRGRPSRTPSRSRRRRARRRARAPGAARPASAGPRRRPGPGPRPGRLERAQEDEPLRGEAVERREAGDGRGADEEERRGDGHRAGEAAEVVELPGPGGVVDRAGAEEEEPLERGVVHHVEDGAGEAEHDQRRLVAGRAAEQREPRCPWR